jgi:hypothetical protein
VHGDIGTYHQLMTFFGQGSPVAVRCKLRLPCRAAPPSPGVPRLLLAAAPPGTRAAPTLSAEAAVPGAGSSSSSRGKKVAIARSGTRAGDDARAPRPARPRGARVRMRNSI